MHALADSVLSSVGSLSERLGPVSSLVDVLVDRVIPTATVKACHGDGYKCWVEPCYSYYPRCLTPEGYIIHAADNASLCGFNEYTCLQCRCDH